MDLRDDILALLEGEALGFADLVQYCRRPDGEVRAVLYAMADEGLVRRDLSGNRGQWSLGPAKRLTDEPPRQPLPTPTSTTTVVTRPRPAYLDQFETVWTPHRDAPSLTGGADGMGASLSGAAFMVGISGNRGRAGAQ